VTGNELEIAGVQKVEFRFSNTNFFISFVFVPFRLMQMELLGWIFLQQ
jgi:hypothetical protein